jgi:transposase, IS5 family
MRRFVGIDLGREPARDETTVCRFRHLLEEHDLGRPLFDEVQRQLAAKGLKVATGTIVDATIINARSSTKNADKRRDPEMHQTKKGNQWYFGMKGHFGVDSRSKLMHAVVATPANIADSKVLPICCTATRPACGAIRRIAASGRVIRQHAPRAQDFVNRRYRHGGVVDEIERAKNRSKSKVRAKGCAAGDRKPITGIHPHTVIGCCNFKWRHALASSLSRPSLEDMTQNPLLTEAAEPVHPKQ